MTQRFDQNPGLAALFDLSFTRFVTISFIRVLYILGMVLIAMGWLSVVAVTLIGAFTGGNVVQGLFVFVFALLFATVAACLYLILLRVSLELIVVIFRIGENTAAIAAHQGATPPTGGFPVDPMPR